MSGAPKLPVWRVVARWIHLVLAIPIVGYIYSPFENIPDYAFPTRFIFVPLLVITGLWMWQGHRIHRSTTKNQ